jgi:hypothetical protein
VDFPDVMSMQFLLNQGQTVNKKKAPMDNREINLRRTGNNSDRRRQPNNVLQLL